MVVVQEQVMSAATAGIWLGCLPQIVSGLMPLQPRQRCGEGLEHVKPFFSSLCGG